MEEGRGIWASWLKSALVLISPSSPSSHQSPDLAGHRDLIFRVTYDFMRVETQSSGGRGRRMENLRPGWFQANLGCVARLSQNQNPETEPNFPISTPRQGHLITFATELEVSTPMTVCEISPLRRSCPCLLVGSASEHSAGVL